MYKVELSWWNSEEKRVAIVLDASSLGERFVVLAVSIVCRGCAIPVTWVVVKAAEKGKWQPHWVRLFAHLQDTVPPDWFVIVLADRGLYSEWLYRLLVTMKWHPFLRINKTGTFCKAGSSQFLPLTTLLPGTNYAWSGTGHCFKSNPVACTLLAGWDDDHQDPWLVMTDLAPNQADVFWYAMRSWIESGFKHSKRAGWQWQSTKMTEPERATRLWLAIAVATLWVVSVGNQAEDTLPVASFDDLPLTHIARRVSNRSKPRSWLIFAAASSPFSPLYSRRKPCQSAISNQILGLLPHLNWHFLFDLSNLIRLSILVLYKYLPLKEPPSFPSPCRCDLVRA